MLKKVVSLVLSATMLMTATFMQTIQTASAETEILISGNKLVPGYTLMVSGAQDGAACAWEVSEDGAAWVAIDGAQGESYTIKNAQANKKIRVSVTVGEETAYSNVVEIGANLGTPDRKTEFPYDTNPAEYLATIQDDATNKTTFSLLDTTDGAEGKEFFALLGYAVASAPFAGNGPTAKFDPTDPENIGYWMNDEKNGLLAGNKMKSRYTYASSKYTANADEDGDDLPDQKEVGSINGLRSLKTVLDPYVVEHP